MVFHAADFDGLHFILPGDAAEERPEPFAQFRCNEPLSFLGAEDAMKIGTDVGHASHSAVPSELLQFRIFPGVETQRNLQPPLRGWFFFCDGYPQLKLRAIIEMSRWDNCKDFLFQVLSQDLKNIR